MEEKMENQHFFAVAEGAQLPTLCVGCAHRCRGEGLLHILWSILAVYKGNDILEEAEWKEWCIYGVPSF